MKFAYAFRRGTFHPHHGTGLPPSDQLPSYLKLVREMGFDGIELGLEAFRNGATEVSARALRAQLEDAGLACAAVRGGGGTVHPRVAARNRQQLEDAILCAFCLGAPIVNMTVTTPSPVPGGPGNFVGDTISHGGSRGASEDDFERTARGIRVAATLAADHGMDIAIEIHQHSIADNSWSALHLLREIDRTNVGINPDLGNIYWTYDLPEESCEDAITALAPHTKYWHCKNLQRVYIPNLNHAIFLQVPLPDGDIDYRFAISAVAKAGFEGYLAIEGVRLGDQFHKDGKSIAYVKSVLDELGSKESET